MTSKATSNPYEILTDDLVEKALCKEFGTNARLESYKVVDFTKKGDNFASIVTSVQVEYDLDGTKGHQSYVVKLSNYCIEVEYIIEVFRFMYLREPLALGPILDSMNKLLDDLNQPSIKAPRCLSSCTDRGKEAMVAEDLRNYGFIMFDKMKGMDYKHATFVMEELGRFHATSILFEIGLKGSTIEKEFPPFDDPQFMNQDNPSLLMASQDIKAQLQLSIDIHNSIRNVEELNKWWDNMKNFTSIIWVRSTDASEKFNVLIHGDCWNNNMLFRYNETGEPIDYRLVDFQMARRSSPACDLVYFFYSSLTGEMRQKFKIKLLVDYYLSFSKILMLSQQPVPFTFDELRSEIKTRMITGLVSSMFLLPTILVKPEDAIEIHEIINQSSQTAKEKRLRFFNNTQKSPDIKSRFMSMFDEMSQAGIFEKTRTIYNPYELLTEELVEEALQNDIGRQAQLKAFEIRKFTNKGDNYASIVIGILVHYEEDEISKRKTYVVKINPQRELGEYASLFQDLYKKEILVLSTIVVGMNKELSKIELPPIKAPKALSFRSESLKEILIMSNLRLEGFVMYDRKKGVDLKHGLLVMKEIGRFHASSLLYEDMIKRPIREEFQNEFAEEWIHPDDPGIKMFNGMLGAVFNSSIEYLKGLPDYKIVIDWLNKKRDSAAITFTPPYNPENKKFNVLSHGDCWNNNIMFKYDTNGDPIDIRLVDFQGSRILSVGCDLNYFLYSSTTGDVRKEFMRHFLVEYYLSFSKVLLLAVKAVPFTFEELKKEVKDKMLFGCITSIFLLPFAVGDNTADTFTFDDINTDAMTDSLEDQVKRFKTSDSESKIFYSRFLDMLDEMMQNGVIT